MKIYAKTDQFAKCRILGGMTQRELAKRTGLSNAYISLIERELKSVSPATALRICKVLHKDLEELFDLE